MILLFFVGLVKLRVYGARRGHCGSHEINSTIFDTHGIVETKVKMS